MSDTVIQTWIRLGYPKDQDIAEALGMSKERVGEIISNHLRQPNNKKRLIESEKKRLLTLLEGYIFELQQANIGEATKEEINAIKTNYNRQKEIYDKLC